MFNTLPKSVRIIEVGPRDGLQNEAKVLDLSTKVEFIDRLALTGLETIEVTSFVRADKIPQMGDAKELFKTIKERDYYNKLNLPCLVPNTKGMELAIDNGVKEVAIFTATSNTFNQRNINATIEESLERFRPVAKLATDNGIKIRGYISTVFGCPYEGETSVDSLMDILSALKDMGCYEISLGDTIGVANPLQVKNVLSRVFKIHSANELAMHFHDTRGLALANTLASLEMGATNFDSSAAGLGGCPYAKGATGNVATEDVVYMLESMGVSTGVDLEKMAHASKYILEALGKESSSKYLTAYLASGK
ncbi:hydroxymethylglutaryl-CoA lyase [Halobacteriovorax marinus]|uniref:hydroxymethylglutaryl-CoA lyase n=1 Tax=Halobacteriovorax marinus TaxID=97084 RepID=UPI003A91A780